MSEQKKCPGDRGKLLIGLECCRKGFCHECPYYAEHDCGGQATDALAYICYLEEKLEGMKNAERD